MKRIIAFSLFIALAGAIPAFSAAGFRVVAHHGVHTTTLSKSGTSAIFMKRTLTWEDGTPIVVTDQSERSEVRISFTTAIHGKSVSAVRGFWNQQIFSGRDIPPVEKMSDAEILAFVKKTPGAIGYVSDAMPTPGVTVITIQ